MGPGPRFEPESQDPQSHRMTTYPTPANENKSILSRLCGSRDSNPGRPASTGPKPVSFGRSDTPATKRGKEIPKYLSNIKNAPTGIRTRVFGSKGRNDWPDYTTGAYIQIKVLLTWAQWGSNPWPSGYEPDALPG